MIVIIIDDHNLEQQLIVFKSFCEKKNIYFIEILLYGVIKFRAGGRVWQAGPSPSASQF